MGVSTTTRGSAKRAAQRTIRGQDDNQGILTLPGMGPTTMREGETAPGMVGKEMVRVTAKQRLYLEGIARTTSQSKQGKALRKQARTMLANLDAAQKKHNINKKPTVRTTKRVKGKGTPTYTTKKVTPKKTAKKKKRSK